MHAEYRTLSLSFSLSPISASLLLLLKLHRAWNFLLKILDHRVSKFLVTLITVLCVPVLITLAVGEKCMQNIVLSLSLCHTHTHTYTHTHTHTDHAQNTLHTRTKPLTSTTTCTQTKSFLIFFSY